MSIKKFLERGKKWLKDRKVREPLPGRTVVRSHGCWNCKAFENGELYEKHKLSTGLRDVRVLTSQGKTQGQIANIIAGRETRLREAGAGICLGGGSKGDFVSSRYLCDRWVGRVGVDRFTGGIDPLPEELKDAVDTPSSLSSEVKKPS